MGKIIKLCMRKADRVYGGRFLITTYDEEVTSIWDIERKCEISMPALPSRENYKLKWQIKEATKATNSVIIFCIVGCYEKREAYAIFLRATNNFIKQPLDRGRRDVLLCDDVEVTDKIICCRVAKATYYFNAFGNMLASIEADEFDGLYTVKLENGETIKSVEEVQQVDDMETGEIIGLSISILTDSVNKNSFYVF